MTPAEAIAEMKRQFDAFIRGDAVGAATVRETFPALLAAVEAATEMRDHFPQRVAAIRSGSIKRFDAAISALARKVEEMGR